MDISTAIETVDKMDLDKLPEDERNAIEVILNVVVPVVAFANLVVQIGGDESDS